MLSENISTPIYVECDKMYRSKVCVQEFSYFVSGLDIQLEKSEYDSPVCKKNLLQVAKYNKAYTIFFEQSIRTVTNRWLSGYYWLRLVAESQRLGFDY